MSEARTQLSRPVFNYGELAQKDVKVCETAVAKIESHQRKVAASIIAIGKELLQVKERLDHGQFGPWLKHHFGWSNGTAHNMMLAAEAFGEFPNFGNLSIDQSALYLLSSDRCDDDTREELLERAQQGERITHALVKAQLDDDEEAEPPSYEDLIDRIARKVRSLADNKQNYLLVARLKILCEEIERNVE